MPLSLDRISADLARREPGLDSDLDERDAASRRAAVAMILRPGRSEDSGVEVLFIERARFDGDPWSGHMAFPGGRVETSDADARAAAERETLEEVGVSLVGAERIGQLDDLRGRHAGREIPMVISAYVYRLDDPSPLVPNYEVEEAFWFPLDQLLDPGRRTHYQIRGLDFPGLLVGRPRRHVVWGLTYRFVESFFERLERPLPDRWADVAEFRDGRDEDIEAIEKRLLRDEPGR